MTFARQLILMLILWVAVPALATTWQAEVLPADHSVRIDSVTGVKLTFLTTKTRSENVYFSERSWLSDESMIIFYGVRGLMGYLTATGELVVMKAPIGYVTSATCAARRPSIFCMRGGDLLELTPEVTLSTDPTKKPSTVKIHERLITTLPKSVQLNSSDDDEYIGVGVKTASGMSIRTIRIRDGVTRELRAVPEGGGGSHVAWSRSKSNLLTYAGKPDRLMLIDPAKGVPRSIYTKTPDELITHESWWIDDQILFCGSVRPHGQDQSHVKVIDPKTGTVRIVGAGAWLPGISAADLAVHNWWHAAGSVDGRWIIADNWHGDLVLFEGTTTRPHWLTKGHRKYGSGWHPHAGWDRRGEKVIFASYMLTHVKNDVRVCIATIPEAMQKVNPAKKR
jgi:hypothetical protein